MSSLRPIAKSTSHDNLAQAQGPAKPPLHKRTVTMMGAFGNTLAPAGSDTPGSASSLKTSPVLGLPSLHRRGVSSLDLQPPLPLNLESPPLTPSSAVLKSRLRITTDTPKASAAMKHNPSHKILDAYCALTPKTPAPPKTPAWGLTSAASSPLPTPGTNARRFRLALNLTCATPRDSWTGELSDPESERRRKSDAESHEKYCSNLRELFTRQIPRECFRENPRNDSRQTEFYERVKAALTFSQSPSYPSDEPLIKRLNSRGTYLIHVQDPRIVDEWSTITSLLPSCSTSWKLIFDYSVQPFAIFKAHDEGHGGVNNRIPRKPEDRGVSAKPGIPSVLEPQNEVLTAMIGPLRYIVMDAELSDTHFRQEESSTSIMTPSSLKPKMVTKRGALQTFIPSISLDKLHRATYEEIVESFSVDQVQATALIDLSLLNTDRNEGNILANGTPIDHALILPAGFRSGAKFEWMKWPQSLQPFTETSIDRIGRLNFKQDYAIIKAAFPEYPEQNLEILQFAYYILQQGATAELTPFEIGCFYTGNDAFSAMCRIYEKAQAIAGGESPEKTHDLVRQAIDATIEHVKNMREEIASELEGTPSGLQNRLEREIANFAEEHLKQLATGNEE